MKKFFFGVASILFLVLQGCETYKNVPYFKDIPDSARLSIATSAYHELTIQQGDILNVSIQTIDPQANAIFNQLPVVSGQLGVNNVSSLVGSAIGATTQTSATGYTVNSEGIIELPMLGKIKVAGLTTNIAADTIEQRVAFLYKLPAVSVRFANLRVNVLGEVLRPGVYNLQNEKNSILEALAQAGDLSVFGRRENVLLIRDSAGQKNFIRFSLNSKDLARQDFFYLRQNDIIYVEPGKGKAASLDAAKSRNYAIIASVLSLLVVIATRAR